MKRSIRYDVDYVFAGFDNIEKYGHCVFCNTNVVLTQCW